MEERWQTLTHELWTCRLRVEGGWLYRYDVWDEERGKVTSVTMCYVPDLYVVPQRSLPPAD